MHLILLLKKLFPLLAIVFCSICEIAICNTPQGTKSIDQYDISYYKGRAVSNPFGTLLIDEWNYLDSEIRVVSLAYLLNGKIREISFETEGQIAKHEGTQDHWETNILLNTRLTFFEDVLPVSVSFGQGVSYAFGTPVNEQDASTNSNRFLNYFQTELVFGILFLPYYPRLVFRIHHRSGVFGVYCEESCGSNIPVLGLRCSF